MPSAVFDFRRCPSFFEQNFKVEDRLQPQHYVPFKLNSAQLDFVKLCATVQEQKQLTWIIAIKPRRVGLSRVVTGIGTMMAFAIAGMDGMVMAQLGSTLGKILESYNVMARGLPTRVRLGAQADSGGGRAINKISIGKGRRPSTITGSKALATGEGRGGAALFMQLTEAAHYPPTSPLPQFYRWCRARSIRSSELNRRLTPTGAAYRSRICGITRAGRTSAAAMLCSSGTSAPG